MAKKNISILIFPILILLLFSLILPHQGSAYFGGLLGRGIYGLGGLYGFGGLGGLYGMGLYGLGGLGLYGLGGLYGMGLYGLGGLYGMNSLALDFLSTGFLLNELGLLKTSTPSTPTATTQALLPLAPFSPISLSPLPALPIPVAGIAGTTLLPLYIAEQAGTWVGEWIAVNSTASAIPAGPMTLDIVKDPFIAGAVSGFAVLELNAFLGAGVTLNGTASNNIVTLQGSVQTTFGPKPLTVDIICTLNTPTHMTGTYQVADYQGGSVKIYEVGQFELELLPALI